MKLLLINPRIRENQPPNTFPVGLGVIAAVMRREGHEVRVYDENALRPDAAEVRRDLARIRGIDVIGLGGLVTVYQHVKELVPLLKELFPATPVVLGGGLTVDPDLIFERLPVDFCVHGEGEHTFRELVAALASRAGDHSRIAGLSFLDRKAGRVVTTLPRPLESNLDRFPMPAYDLFPSEIYFANLTAKIGEGTRRCASLLWSRGCPNQCTFCWRIMGRGVRFRSLGLVMDEIVHLRSEYGVDSYLFYDECINAGRKRAQEFAATLVDRGLAAPWYSHARVTPFDDELAALFRRSGCVGLNFGIESGSPRMLAEIKKNVSLEQAGRAVAAAMKCGIKPVCTFIIGMPGETRATVQESIDWIRRNRVHRHAAFFIATPYPGCELYAALPVQERIRRRYDTKDAFFSALGDADQLYVNLTDFTDEELLELVDQATREVARESWPRELAKFSGRLLRLAVQPDRWSGVLRRRWDQRATRREHRRRRERMAT